MENPYFVEWDRLAEEIIREGVGDVEEIVLRFVKLFCEANDNGPTVQEICWAVDRVRGKGTISSSHVNWILRKLEASKLIALYRRNKRVGGRIRLLPSLQVDSWKDYRL